MSSERYPQWAARVSAMSATRRGGRRTDEEVAHVVRVVDAPAELLLRADVVHADLRGASVLRGDAGEAAYAERLLPASAFGVLEVRRGHLQRCVCWYISDD